MLEAAAKVQPDGPIYAHVSTDMLRFFTADFYTADRVRPFELDNPESGVMLIGVEDGRKWLPEHADRYEFQLLEAFQAAQLRRAPGSAVAAFPGKIIL